MNLLYTSMIPYYKYLAVIILFLNCTSQSTHIIHETWSSKNGDSTIESTYIKGERGKSEIIKRIEKVRDTQKLKFSFSIKYGAVGFISVNSRLVVKDGCAIGIVSDNHVMRKRVYFGIPMDSMKVYTKPIDAELARIRVDQIGPYIVLNPKRKYRIYCNYSMYGVKFIDSGIANQGHFSKSECNVYVNR